jgi:putative spermidine/putrescine transport system ATP-binding protein
VAEPAGVALSGIVKRYGTVTALGGIDLEVRRGELLTILGPSGSGKTTLLKVIAGFEIPERGSVRLGGIDVTEVFPAKRNVGMVFQNYALFPHMTVRDNVAFPLDMRRVPRAEADERIARALTLVELSGYEQRLPAQLSGGQQQRVALARAIVFDPSVLLLDEPFGALDRKLREAMQLEVKRLQRRLGLTTVFITHDQEEALVLADRIAVMSQGRIEQLGLPDEIYDRPANAFVADFVGESNILPGRIAAVRSDGIEVALDGGATVHSSEDVPAREGERVGVLIRPERLKPAGAAVINRFSGAVLETVYLGVSRKHRIKLDIGPELLVRLPVDAPQTADGAPLAVTVDPADVRLLPVAPQ